jgi:SAM-dependent methyltransferase
MTPRTAPKWCGATAAASRSSCDRRHVIHLGDDNRGALRHAGGVLSDLVSILRDPVTGESELTLTSPLEEGSEVMQGVLRAPSGATSMIDDGVWEAMGGRRAQRTLAQFSNRVPPTPQLYERLWRGRSLTLLSKRPFPLKEELAELNVAIEPVAGQIIVDVACSEGLYGRTLAASGAQVLAVDHSEPFLQRTRKHANDLRVSVTPVRALAQHLPFGDATADAVVMGGSLNEIGDQPAALAEMGRICRPGGRWFVMCLTSATKRGGKIVQTLARPTGIDFFSRDATVAMAESAGLKVTTVVEDGVVIRMSGTRA